MEAAGFATLSLIGCEGLACERDDVFNALAPELWRAWVELNYRAGQDPSLLGASQHLLYVGKKA
jgi:hypothetical protein